MRSKSIRARVRPACPECDGDEAAPCVRCGARRTIDELFSAWLAVPPRSRRWRPSCPLRAAPRDGPPGVVSGTGPRRALAAEHSHLLLDLQRLLHRLGPLARVGGDDGRCRIDDGCAQRAGEEADQVLVGMDAVLVVEL